MRAPADSYWSIDECRWVRYAVASLEIPDQRDADEAPAATVEVEVAAAGSVLAASGDDLHR
jgi:hypothetical protein